MPEAQLSYTPNGNNVFVFVVCGGREHIDTLGYSIKALKRFSRNEVFVVTDDARNEIPILHDNVISVKTPVGLNHHQASIFLKTSLHRYLPKGKLYCYLDSDVVAVNVKGETVFDLFQSPIVFAQDHCVMDKFSPSAVNCNCKKQYAVWADELRTLFKKYELLERQPENERKKEMLLDEFEKLKKNKLLNAWTSLRFWLSPNKFRLHDDAILVKEKEVWQDADGNAILYEKEDSAIAAIERVSDYRCHTTNDHKWTIHGCEVFDCRCNHLKNQIEKTFGIEVSQSQWHHWNGGVFLFNEESHSFLDEWHSKTTSIFNKSEWKTRDQGTLIATVWEFGLNNHPTLPVEFNLIADIHHQSMHHIGNLRFKTDSGQQVVEPNFIHVYHHWGDRNWEVWREVETRTGISWIGETADERNIST